MVKSDIKDAFCLIPISETDYHLLEYQWDSKFYYDASSSCQVLEAFSKALQWILNEKFHIHWVSHLLDDFFFSM